VSSSSGVLSNTDTPSGPGGGPSAGDFVEPDASGPKQFDQTDVSSDMCACGSGASTTVPWSGSVSTLVPLLQRGQFLPRIGPSAGDFVEPDASGPKQFDQTDVSSDMKTLTP
jgi:hypothetical protein